MKKFKNIFLVTLLIDLLTAITLVLFLFNPEMMEEAVYSQFEGINQGWERCSLFNSHRFCMYNHFNDYCCSCCNEN